MITDDSLNKVTNLVNFDLRILDKVPYDIHIVKSHEEYRPDIISQNVYNTRLLSSLLMYTNKIYSIYSLRSGLKLKVYDRGIMYLLYKRFLK